MKDLPKLILETTISTFKEQGIEAEAHLIDAELSQLGPDSGGFSVHLNIGGKGRY